MLQVNLLKYPMTRLRAVKAQVLNVIRPDSRHQRNLLRSYLGVYLSGLIYIICLLIRCHTIICQPDFLDFDQADDDLQNELISHAEQIGTAYTMLDEVNPSSILAKHMRLLLFH